MTSEHLLPANATPLEQALSLATDALSRLALPTDAIRQFKTDPSDPLLPWLIWEYVAPYGFADSPASLQRLLTRATERNTRALAAPSRIALASHHVGWRGQTWTGVRWPSSTWTDTRELIGSAHSTQS